MVFQLGDPFSNCSIRSSRPWTDGSGSGDWGGDWANNGLVTNETREAKQSREHGVTPQKGLVGTTFSALERTDKVAR